jgi:2-methylcitrate dehydratase PrpD
MKIEHRIVDSILSTGFDQLSGSVVEATKKSIIDTLAVMIAGRKAEGCEAIVQLVKGWAGKRESTVLSYGFKIPSPNAVFANGVMARAMDLDEVHDIGTVHPSATVIPAALGTAEAIGGVSGKDFIVANALGIDLICRMSLSPAVGACVSGMNFSFQCGTFGAGAAAGKLLKLTRDEMLNALGIAYSQAAGNSQCYIDGSLTIRVQQGLSAKAGIVSALLAQKGITGAENFFEGKFGYFNIYHGGKFDREILLRDLGEHFEGIHVSQKPLYSCCKFTHASIEAARALVSENKIRPDQIAQVKALVTSQEVFNLVCDPMDVKQRPRTLVDAQFSLPYTIALALVKGKVALNDFTNEAIQDNEVLKVAQRVQVILKSAEGRAVLPAPGIIELQTAGGERYKKEVNFVKGHPRNPNSIEDCLEKMRACIEYSKCKKIGRDFQRISDLLSDLENVNDIRRVIRLLSFSEGRS